MWTKEQIIGALMLAAYGVVVTYVFLHAQH